MAQVILHPREGRSPKDYALMYAGLGWKVFPIWYIRSGMMGDNPAGTCGCPKDAECDRPGKHPIGDLCPSGASDATTERSKIEAWWGNRPQASVGIATGAVSGLTVVDADTGTGKPGVINLTRLCVAHGGMPQTMTVSTGGGGLHLYFKYNAALRTGVNVLDEAIDVRNDGGYVVAPPSNHASGQIYKWREERAEWKEVPEWMINEPREHHERAAARRRGRPRTKEALPLEKVEGMLKFIDPDDRDRWLQMGLLLGRLYVGSESEGEAWSIYETWSARSEKFDENRSENITRMRQQFSEISQQSPRPGATALGTGTLILWAKESGWSPFGERAVVRYEPGNEAKMCEELVGALVADHTTNRFYNVMGEVRDVIRSPLPSMRSIQSSLSKGENPPEKLQVRKTQISGIQCALSEKAVLAVYSASTGLPSAKPIPSDLVGMMLKDRATDFPTLTGIAEWPMVMDGRIISKQRGYDVETGLFFDIDEKVVLDLVLTPEKAWWWLKSEFLLDFPFESSLHEAGALALMLAMMLRPLMKTCPAFGIVAPQPGTGKSTLIEAAGMAIYGSPVNSHAFSSDDEELRKALHALMIAKIPLVMFDNVGRGRAIASDHLAKMITSETATDRTLGSSETRQEVNTLLMTFTGNNISFVRDMASRVLTVRLNARTSNPLGRRFKHPDIKTWAETQRSAVLSSLIAIGKLSDGQPEASGRPSRFEDFDAMVVKPVLLMTGKDVRLLESTADVDTEEDEHTRDTFMEFWRWQQGMREQENGEAWRAAEIISAISARAFPEATVLSIRRWAGDARQWENDPIRTLAYALRAVRDDYKYSPYLLKAKTVRDGTRWFIVNSEAGAEGSQPTSNAF